jgi:hypothetical protein
LSNSPPMIDGTVTSARAGRPNAHADEVLLRIVARFFSSRRRSGGRVIYG